MIEGSVLIGDMTILNRHMPNNRASNYLKQNQIELQGETDEPTIIAGDFNTPLSEDPASRESKNMANVNSSKIHCVSTYQQ